MIVLYGILIALVITAVVSITRDIKETLLD